MKERFEVEAVRAGERARVSLDAERLPDGNFEIVVSGALGEHHGGGPDLFEALREVRRSLEVDGWRLAVQGARRDTWPSGMLRDQLDGGAVYVLTEDVKAKPETVGTFDPAPAELVGTVAEQEDGWEAWRRLHR